MVIRFSKVILSLLREAFSEWQKDQVPRLGAALAYYTVFSLTPLLVILLGIVGLVFDHKSAQLRLLEQFQSLLGKQGSEAVALVLQNVNQPSLNWITTIVGTITLFIGASGVFAELQCDLNAIWKAPPIAKTGFLRLIKDRLFSFSLVLATGFLLLVSLVISAILTALGNIISGLPGLKILWQFINIFISLGITALLFAMIFKILPNTKVRWRDVWIAASLTSLLFTIGKFLIGLYLGNSSIASSYGAAGSLVVLLIWLYYSAQILFFGAEFSKVYALRYGSHAMKQ
jgi:membrane protein